MSPQQPPKPFHFKSLRRPPVLPHTLRTPTATTRGPSPTKRRARPARHTRLVPSPSPPPLAQVPPPLLWRPARAVAYAATGAVEDVEDADLADPIVTPDFTCEPATTSLTRAGRGGGRKRSEGDADGARAKRRKVCRRISLESDAGWGLMLAPDEPGEDFGGGLEEDKALQSEKVTESEEIVESEEVVSSEEEALEQSELLMETLKVGEETPLLGQDFNDKDEGEEGNEVCGAVEGRIDSAADVTSAAQAASAAQAMNDLEATRSVVTKRPRRVLLLESPVIKEQDAGRMEMAGAALQSAGKVIRSGDGSADRRLLLVTRAESPGRENRDSTGNQDTRGSPELAGVVGTELNRVSPTERRRAPVAESPVLEQVGLDSIREPRVDGEQVSPIDRRCGSLAESPVVEQGSLNSGRMSIVGSEKEEAVASNVEEIELSQQPCPLAELPRVGHCTRELNHLREPAIEVARASDTDSERRGSERMQHRCSGKSPAVNQIRDASVAVTAETAGEVKENVMRGKESAFKQRYGAALAESPVVDNNATDVVLGPELSEGLFTAQEELSFYTLHTADEESDQPTLSEEHGGDENGDENGDKNGGVNGVHDVVDVKSALEDVGLACPDIEESQKMEDDVADSDDGTHDGESEPSSQRSKSVDISRGRNDDVDRAVIEKAAGTQICIARGADVYSPLLRRRARLPCSGGNDAAEPTIGSGTPWPFAAETVPPPIVAGHNLRVASPKVSSMDCVKSNGSPSRRISGTAEKSVLRMTLGSGTGTGTGADSGSGSRSRTNSTRTSGWMVTEGQGAANLAPMPVMGIDKAPLIPSLPPAVSSALGKDSPARESSLNRVVQVLASPCSHPKADLCSESSLASTSTAPPPETPCDWIKRMRSRARQEESDSNDDEDEDDEPEWTRREGLRELMRFSYAAPQLPGLVSDDEEESEADPDAEVGVEVKLHGDSEYVNVSEARAKTDTAPDSGNGEERIGKIIDQSESSDEGGETSDSSDHR